MRFRLFNKGSKGLHYYAVFVNNFYNWPQVIRYNLFQTDINLYIIQLLDYRTDFRKKSSMRAIKFASNNINCIFSINVFIFKLCRKKRNNFPDSLPDKYRQKPFPIIKRH